MSTPPTPAKANEPLVTDDELASMAESFIDRKTTLGVDSPARANREALLTVFAEDVRELYEQDRTKLLADLAAMREAGNKMRDALRYNLAVYARKDEPMMLKAMEAWDALTPPK